LLSSVTYGYNDSLEWGDLLTSYGGVTITYDAIGNPLSYYNGSLYAFEWENGRQLAKATLANTEITFTYNSEGIRTSKTINDEIVHKYHLSDTNIISEEWETNLLVYLYESDGSPLGMQYRTSTMDEGEFYTFWFEKNLQGDIVAVYNAYGIKIISYTYDAWGNCATTYHSISGNNYYAIYNPFRYRGYYYDTELGFYYLNSRYYDPSVGRFITADKFSTIKASSTELTNKNLYAYCDNNPVSRNDDGGTFWDTVFDVISLATSIAEVVATPTNPWAWAGVVGDVVDLIPFVTGVGELTKAVRVGANAVDTAKDIFNGIDAAQELVDAGIDIKKATGSYEILYKSGKNYVGKGGLKRAVNSALEHAKPNKLNNNLGDEILSIRWKSAPNSRQAFIDEFEMQLKRGVNNQNTYNKIWSPGRKYFYGNVK